MPDDNVTIPNVGNRTCAEFQNEGDTGIIPTLECPNAPEIAADCECIDVPSAVPSITSSGMPSSMPASGAVATSTHLMAVASLLTMAATVIIV